MSKAQKERELLNEFIKLLQIEKEVLIKNDAAKLAEIVEQKQNYLVSFESLTIETIQKEELTAIFAEIENLQRTNLLLTKQALDFQQTVMDAFSKGMQKGKTTYSKKGIYDNAGDQASVINQSV